MSSKIVILNAMEAMMQQMMEIPDTVGGLNDVTCGTAQAVHIDVADSISEIYSRFYLFIAEEREAATS